MSEKLENNKDKKVKRNTSTKKPKVKKKVLSEKINAEYKYNIVDDEKLIVDKPSKPLGVKTLETKTSKMEIRKNDKIKKSVTLTQTNGQIYNAYIKELKDFKLVYNDDIIYDSTLAKSMINLKFESDYFILFGKKYSYNGLRVQKI